MQKHQRSRLSTVSAGPIWAAQRFYCRCRQRVVGLMIGLRISRMSWDRNRLNSRPPKNRGQAAEFSRLQRRKDDDRAARASDLPLRYRDCESVEIGNDGWRFKSRADDDDYPPCTNRISIEPQSAPFKRNRKLS